MRRFVSLFLIAIFLIPVTTQAQTCEQGKDLMIFERPNRTFMFSNLSPDEGFDLASSAMTPELEGLIENNKSTVLSYFKNSPHVDVIGLHDGRGSSDTFDAALARRRAEAVAMEIGELVWGQPTKIPRIETKTLPIPNSSQNKNHLSCFQQLMVQRGFLLIFEKDRVKQGLKNVYDSLDAVETQADNNKEAIAENRSAIVSLENESYGQWLFLAILLVGLLLLAWWVSSFSQARNHGSEENGGEEDPDRPGAVEEPHLQRRTTERFERRDDGLDVRITEEFGD